MISPGFDQAEPNASDLGERAKIFRLHKIWTKEEGNKKRFILRYNSRDTPIRVCCDGVWKHDFLGYSGPVSDKATKSTASRIECYNGRQEKQVFREGVIAKFRIRLVGTKRNKNPT